MHVEQAEAVLRALDDLPDDLDPSLVQDAEAHLLAEAEHFDARALKRFGRRLLEVVAPDAADAHEAKLLEREERDAAAATRLTMWEDGHGKVHGRFTLDTLPAPRSRRPSWRSPPPSTGRLRPARRPQARPRNAWAGRSPS